MNTFCYKTQSIGILFILMFTELIAQNNGLLYELNQQGEGNCAGSTVILSVNSAVNIITTEMSVVGSTLAIAGGNVINNGGKIVVQRGVCWATNQNPSINNAITSNGGGLGLYTSDLYQLTPNTTYFLRAYALTSDGGVYYGNEISFSTSSIVGTINSCGVENIFNGELTYSSLIDIDGNIYKTIVIGNQEWMAENFKATRYSNGDSVTFIADPDIWINTGEGAWSNLEGDTFYNCNCGNVYNWYAVSDERNLCPNGWHVPNDQDWNNLLGFVDPEFSPISADAFGINSFIFPTQSDTASYFLKSKNFNLLELPGSYNQSGFSALACGNKSAIDGIHYGFSIPTTFWSSSPGYYYPYTGFEESLEGITRTLYNQNNSVYKNSLNVGNGFPVRCVKNEYVVQLGEINELKCDQYIIASNLIPGAQISNIPINIPYSGANGGIINEMSIQSLNTDELYLNWNADFLGGPYGVIEMQLSGTIPNVDTMRFEIELGGGNCQLKLPTNNASAKLNQDCHTCGARGSHNPEKIYGVSSDVDGQLYQTIQIGNQTWFAENLKTTHYNNGDLIFEVNESPGFVAVNEGAWCYFDYNPQYNCPYGKLYNWQAASDPRGLCPVGWHVSTLSDWQELVAEVDSISIDTLNLPTFILSESANFKLRSTSRQFSTDPNSNASNSSGFSAIPGGLTSYYNDDTFELLGVYSSWWFIPTPEYQIQYPSINFTTENNTVYINENYNYSRGLSIRCVKD
jgi:uncharacterized protein (TIGR02145 family)